MLRTILQQAQLLCSSESLDQYAEGADLRSVFTKLSVI
jgi:hypothetical protein